MIYDWVYWTLRSLDLAPMGQFEEADFSSTIELHYL